MTKKRKSDWLTNSRKKLQFGDVISGTPETSAANSRPGRVRTKTENGVTYMWDTSENKWVRATIPQAKSSNKTSTKKKEVSAREKKQNQAQGSSAKDQQGNIKSTTKAKAKAKTQPKKPAKPSEKEMTSRTASNLSRGNIDKSLRTTGSVNVGSRKSESSTGNKRADRITSRAEKRASKITDRRAKKAAVKSARRAGRDMIREAKGKEPRKKAMLGMLAGPVAGMAANAMQNSDNPTMQKIGKGLGVASNVAGLVGGGPSAGPPAAARKGMMKKKAGDFKSKGKKFPDLTGDGKVTQADILKGRGVTKKGKNGMMKYQEGNIEGEVPSGTRKKTRFEKTKDKAEKAVSKPSKVSKKLKQLEKMPTTPTKGPAIGGLFKKGGMKDRRKRRR